MTKIIKLPGLIDTHVHLREPGATQKEDFSTGTKAAIAGGYTTILDMPNNPEPTITAEALEKKISLARGDSEEGSRRVAAANEVSEDARRDTELAGPRATESRIYADVGLHFGATADSIQYFEQVKDKVFGLKVYMNHTTGTLLQENPKVLENIFSAWLKDKVLMVHAEEETLQKAIELAKKFGNKLHVCHVSLANELSLIKQAKQDGLSITCEVSAHHLFLTEEDAKRLGPFGQMRPPLSTKENQDALWIAIKDGTIDTIASDHAPHTKEEKLNITPPPNGVPGLETTLSLLLTAVSEKRLTIEDIIRLCHDNPAKIFNIPDQAETFVEVDPDEEYEISDEHLYTKCAWTPFEGMKVTGKVKRVVLRGNLVYDNGQVLDSPKGQVIYPKE